MLQTCVTQITHDSSQDAEICVLDLSLAPVSALAAATRNLAVATVTHKQQISEIQEWFHSVRKTLFSFYIINLLQQVARA